MEKNALIYGVKTKNKYHYIGKTNKKVIVNGEISNSKINAQYKNKPLHDIFQNYQDTNIEQILLVPETEWYGEKLNEVINHADQPLLNAQWMLEGKRGYWEGKERDPYTIMRLSQSKFKQYVQYDENGNLIKIWKSGKEAAIKIFGDYKVINGGGNTKLYGITSRPSIRNRFAHDSYWFHFNELINHFNGIPQKLNIENLIKKELEYRKQQRIINAKRKTHTLKYCVERYERSTGELVTIYLNTIEAGYKLRVHIDTVRRLCSGRTRPAANFILKYGEKILQSKNIMYPQYQIQPLKRIKIDK